MPVAKAQDKTALSILPLHLAQATEPIYFSPIITEFSDSYQPRWTAINTYGRMDPIPFYSGTGRQMTLGFRVISDSSAEAVENTIKIQKLLQWQYPVYAPAAGENTRAMRLKSPPYFSFKFLNMAELTTGTYLQGYINGAIQINPGFQSKAQTQYFTKNFEQIVFSDIEVKLRIQIMHYYTPGWDEVPLFGFDRVPGNRNAGYMPNYPYNVGSDKSVVFGTVRPGKLNQSPEPGPTKPQSGASLTDPSTEPQTPAEKGIHTRTVNHIAERERLGWQNTNIVLSSRQQRVDQTIPSQGTIINDARGVT